MRWFGRFGCGLVLVSAIVMQMQAQPSPAALAGFDAYTAKVEGRLARQHSPGGAFETMAPDVEARVRRGEFVVEELTTDKAAAAGALLHHWRGSAFVAGATVSDFESVMRDFDAYGRYFSPEVLRAKTVMRNGEFEKAAMRVRQKHVITVVLDTDYDVRFAHLDPRHGYSISRSTRVREVEDAGTAKERELVPGEEHGFLWRINTYWSYEERDGGLYMQIESVSLTRAIPTGLGWAVKPFVEKVPRESLEFTLRKTCEALRKGSR